MGRNKLDLVMNGETLLQRTARIVAEVTDEVLVTGLPPEREPPLGAIALADAAPNAGPLGGLVAGLRAMRSDRAVLVACDLPYLDSSVLGYLLESLRHADAAVPIVHGHQQTTCAAFRRTALPAAERCLVTKRLSLRAMLATLHVTWLTEENVRTVDPLLASFTNVNTPEDWERLRE